MLLYTYICAFNYVQAVSYDISNSVFRLHVIANSNSNEDQNLKYKVRDALLTYMNKLCENINSKEEAISMAYEHKADFENIILLILILVISNFQQKHMVTYLFQPECMMP